MIIDTNALSAWASADATIQRAIKAADHLFLPVIVLGEFRYGLRGSRFRSLLETRLELLAQTVTVLPITLETASVYSMVRFELKQAGRPIPENDVWIASLCRQHGLPILSRDTHFDHVQKLKRVSW